MREYTGVFGAEPVLADCLVTGAGQLLTMKGGPGPKRGHQARELGILEDAFVASRGGSVVAVGPVRELWKHVKLTDDATVIDARGKVVSPGLVDPHTHLVFAGWRFDEYTERCLGASYLEIAEKGGGILRTVKDTRAASFEELVVRTMGFLDEMLSFGTTTCEAKSGYGLELSAELKQLRVIRHCDMNHPVDLVPTFLGAHAVPVEYRHDRASYVDRVIEMLAPIREMRLATFVDVFCDEGSFNIQESERILTCARDLGFALKIHADELAYTGATELGCRLGATSCDHLLKISDEGIRKLSGSNTVAVLLPATSCFLGKVPGLLGRKLLDSGVAVALGTDFNPGTCTAMSLPLCMTLACSLLGFSPEEAFSAVTWNAAYAAGLGGKVGGLLPGFQMDVVIFDSGDYREIPYRFGTNLVNTVIKRGKVVYHRQKGARLNAFGESGHCRFT